MVLTLDGLVSVYFKRYCEDLKLPTNGISYIQTKVIQKTFEIVMRSDNTAYN